MTLEEIIEGSKLSRMKRVAIDLVVEISDPDNRPTDDEKPAKNVAGFIYRLLVELMSQHEQSGIDAALTDALNAFVARCATEFP